jgi:4'-phosphopantetheinyl transferase
MSAWGAAPRVPRLAEDEVHVWRVRLDAEYGCAEALWAMLSADERARAARFRQQRDRARFVVAHAQLRVILSRYLDIAPERIGFDRDASGKPYVDAPAEHRLRFNLAHSEDLALCAVACAHQVGIDVEHMQPDLAIEALTAQVLAPEERAALERFAPEERVEAFYSAWCRKEAYLKACGAGLARAPSQVVTLTGARGMALWHTVGDAHEAERWALVDLAAAPGYAAALAVEGHGWHLELWEE